jgi:hypothetical protein
LGKGGGVERSGLKKAASSSWDEDLDDLLNSLDSSPPVKKAGGGKSKGKKGNSPKSAPKGKFPASKKSDFDDFLESSESFSSPPPRTRAGGIGARDAVVEDLDLSIASDTVPIKSTGAKASLIDDMMTSQDLDDSILGGLLGGGGSSKPGAGKPTKDKSLPPKHPSSTTSAIGAPPASSGFSSSSTGKKSTDPQKKNDSDIAESNSFDTDDDFALPIFGSSEGRGRTFDKPRPHTSSGIPSHSRSRSRSRSPNLSGSDSSPLPSPAKAGASLSVKNEDSRPYSAPVPSSPDTKSFSNVKAPTWDDESSSNSKPQAEDSSMPFIPSFYDPSRRSRRYSNIMSLNVVIYS